MGNLILLGVLAAVLVLSFLSSFFGEAVVRYCRELEAKKLSDRRGEVLAIADAAESALSEMRERFRESLLNLELRRHSGEDTGHDHFRLMWHRDRLIEHETSLKLLLSRAAQCPLSELEEIGKCLREIQHMASEADVPKIERPSLEALLGA